MDRSALMGIVAGALEGQAWARAVWEGGSAAFGRADGWSDLDAVVLVREGFVDAAFEVVEQALREGAGAIELRHRVPEQAL